MAFPDESKIVAGAIILATLIAAWMFRYESVFSPAIHRNRITGVTCMVSDECWFSSSR
jgi:hypothetical protein